MLEVQVVVIDAYQPADWSKYAILYKVLLVNMMNQ